MCGYCGASVISDEIVARLTLQGYTETAARACLAGGATESFARAGIRVRSWSGRFVVSNWIGGTLVVDRFADVPAAASRLAGRRIEELPDVDLGDLGRLLELAPPDPE